MDNSWHRLADAFATNRNDSDLLDICESLIPLSDGDGIPEATLKDQEMARVALLDWFDDVCQSGLLTYREQCYCQRALLTGLDAKFGNEDFNA